MMRLVVLSVLCLAIACGESFLPPSAVTDFRVVGAKVEVEADPERANPSPGDDVQVSLLPIDRGIPANDDSEEPTLTPGLLQWALVACVPLPTTIGPPVCGPQIEVCEACIEAPPADPLALPVVRFPTPSRDELAAAGASSVLLQGVVCSNGAPSPDAIFRFLTGETDDLQPCADLPTQANRPVEGRVITVQIPIEDDPSDPNLNPTLLSIVLNGGVNGVAWPPPYDQGVPRDAPGTGCAAELLDVPEEQRMRHPRAGDDPSTINLAVTADSLQSFTVDDQELTEEIQVSWLADGGGYSTSFSFITAPATSVLTNWQPFGEAPEDGELVRFNFVIRDGRGGTDWVERGLCILPPEPSSSPP